MNVTARCIQGKVTEVWDERDNPHKPYGSTGSNTSKKNNHKNPYDSYDDGYEDIYEDGDYDLDRYMTDSDYADGVDDAMDDDEDGDW